MALLGRMLRRLRADPSRGPLAQPPFEAPSTIRLTSASFADGAEIPRAHHASKAGGDDISPPLEWSGVPADAAHLVLILDDVDAPARKPFVHNAAVIDPTTSGLPAGVLKDGDDRTRMLTAALGTAYVAPAPLKSHGVHRYRFHLLATDIVVPDTVTTYAELMETVAGHVIARGLLVGTVER